MPLDQLSINDKPYRLHDGSRISAGQRVYQERMRPSQPFEASIQTRSWQVWGPLGNSRASWQDPLGIDYTTNLDHRYEWLLTSTAKRNALTLTSITDFAYGVPISDVSKTNWSEGVGDGDGDAFDELDEGIISGTPDDATTYWTTTSTGTANKLQCNITSLTDPSVDTGMTMRVRYRYTGGTPATDALFVLLSQGTAGKYLVGLNAHSGDWETRAITIPEATVATITDFTDLELAMYIGAGTGTLDLTAMELELPANKFGNVSTLDLNFGFLFAHRGAFATQIEPGGMTEVENNDRTNLITDTVPEFQGVGLLAKGSAAVMDKRTAATASGATYAAITSIDGTHLAVGSDRLFYTDAGLTTAADAGKVKYSFDALASGTESNAFPVADPGAAITGMYTSGPYAMVGFDRGLNSFTASGKAVRLAEAVTDFPSSANFASGDALWGWFYAATKFGTFATNVESGIQNPVGPGEGLRGQAFEGPIDGYPTEVATTKDSVWVAYLNPDGTTYIFRGTFGPETAQTGRPEWFNFRTLTALECHAIGIVERTNPTLVVGEDENIAYYTLSTRGREIADANYEFDTGGGTAFLTTLMLPEGAQGNLRWGKFVTENCDSNNTWLLSVEVDDSGSFFNISGLVSTNGLQTQRPVTGDIPNVTNTFTAIKPRLIQAANSSTAPPQIRGQLTLAFDLRPEQVREIEVVVDKLREEDLANLRTLVSDDTLLPQELRLPTDTGVNLDRYCYISALEVLDQTDPTDMVIRLVLNEWELS